MSRLDSRLHAVRSDLADLRLKGQVDAPAFAEGRPMQVAVPILGVHKEPRFDSMQLTQALMGETLRLFDEHEGYGWVQLDDDGYVGYVALNDLTANVTAPTHRVAVPSTWLYAGPTLKSQPAICVTLNARVTVVGGDEKYARLSNGHSAFAAHLKPLAETASDFVAVAEMFHHVPYYWGGKSVHGLDCSGLVQVALQACGTACLRDSDMQEHSLGQELQINDLDGLRRGDLVFWDGHVGIMSDAQTLLHANGHHMMVASEPLRDAVERIARSYGQITRIRRL